MICSLIIVYFFIYGMSSMQAKSRLIEEISMLEMEYGLVHERRLEFERQTSLLHPDHINPDFLDQESRNILGLMHDDEIIIRHSE